jgi:AcrR family transcriptional regulator
MPRPQQVTDEQIYEATRACFLEHGPAAPVSCIASALGISTAALYQRLGSKEELLRRAFDPGPFQIAEELASGPSPDTPVDAQLAGILDGAIRLLRRVIPGLLVLRATGVPIHPPQASGGEPPTILLRKGLAAWLRRGARHLTQREARDLTELLLGAIEARCFNEHLGGKAFIEGTDAQFRGLLVRFAARQLAVEPGRRPRGRRR